jgi:hypothetical protein
MDGSPIHLACDRWTALLLRHFASCIHEYFDGLHADAIEIARSKKIRDYSFVDGLFQKWCKSIREEWTLKEMKSQIEALRVRYKDLEGLIANVLNTNLMVMSVVRQSNVDQVPEPEVDVSKFVHACYWHVAEEVAFPYYLYFNRNVVDGQRAVYHQKARKLIEKNLKHTITDIIDPILEKMKAK